MMAALEQELLEHIQKLSTEQKKRVLNFVQSLTHPKGELVQDFLERTSSIHISKDDLEIMRRVAEEDEERIAWDDWNNPPTFST